MSRLSLDCFGAFGRWAIEPSSAPERIWKLTWGPLKRGGGSPRAPTVGASTSSNTMALCSLHRHSIIPRTNLKSEKASSHSTVGPCHCKRVDIGSYSGPYITLIACWFGCAATKTRTPFGALDDLLVAGAGWGPLWVAPERTGLQTRM